MVALAISLSTSRLPTIQDDRVDEAGIVAAAGRARALVVVHTERHEAPQSAVAADDVGLGVPEQERVVALRRRIRLCE